MRRTWCLAVLLCLATAPRPCAAADVVGPAPSVGRLVEQLGDEDFRQRDLASRQLQQLGPDILPQLRAARGHADPEVVRRLDELIGNLETASLLAPRLVTLHLRGKTAKQALDAIARQTGYKIEAWNSNDPPGRFDFDGVPFWEAVDRVCRSAGLVVQQGYGDDAVHVIAQDSYVPYVCYDNAFRLVADGLHQSRDIEFSSLPKNPNQTRRTESLDFRFSIFSEPRLPLLGVGAAKLEAAYDNDNNSMLPVPGPGDGPFGVQSHVTMRYGNGYRSYCQQISVALGRPSGKATGIKLIKGTVPVTLLAQEKPEVVTDKLLQAKGKKFKVPGAAFAVLDVSETPNKQYQVHFTVTDESKDASDNDFTWVNSLFYRLEVLDEKGQKLQVFGSSWMNSSSRHVEMTMTYGAPGNGKATPPAKLVYHTWTTTQVQVSFAFRDLPLP